MKIYEILSLNQELLEKLNNFGIKTSDYKFVYLYLEYINLKKTGHKTMYSVAYLSDKYKICERKVYKVIKSMEKDCILGAV